MWLKQAEESRDHEICDHCGGQKDENGLCPSCEKGEDIRQLLQEPDEYKQHKEFEGIDKESDNSNQLRSAVLAFLKAYDNFAVDPSATIGTIAADVEKLRRFIGP